MKPGERAPWRYPVVLGGGGGLRGTEPRPPRHRRQPIRNISLVLIAVVLAWISGFTLGFVIGGGWR